MIEDYDYSPITDELHALTRTTGKPISTVFRDFIDVVLNVFGWQSDSGVDLKQYGPHTERDSEARDHFSSALGPLLEAYNEIEYDVVGDLYEQLGMANESSGQYFTPRDVASVVAQMHLEIGNPGSGSASTSTSTSASDSPMTVHDPTCGSGRMLISAVQCSDEQLHVSGIDSSPLTAKLATVNLAILNTRATIWHGDSLTLKMHRRWDVVPTSFSLGWVSSTTDDDEVAFPQSQFQSQSQPDDESTESGPPADPQPHSDDTATLTDFL